MPEFKKKCELLLEDSSPSGRIFCSLSNWDGLCLKIPKSRLSDSATMKGVNNTGIYFLVGEENGTCSIYIGEAEGVYSRLKQHIKEDTWQEVYVVTKKDNSLNKAHVKYLESTFYDLAVKSSRYKVLNKNKPTKSSISDFDTADMKEFIYYVTMSVELLGCKAFDDIKFKKSAFEDFYINSVGIEASGRMLDDEFVVLKGSCSRKEFKEASDRKLKEKWQALRDGEIVKNDIFARDYSFASPSLAAAMVLGRNANGLTEWKTKDKKTLKSVLEAKR